jgi:hypothetical protein
MVVVKNALRRRRNAASPIRPAPKSASGGLWNTVNDLEEIRRAIIAYEEKLDQAKADLSHVSAAIAIFEGVQEGTSPGPYVDADRLFASNAGGEARGRGQEAACENLDVAQEPKVSSSHCSRMADLSHLPPLERAKQYRALAQEARVQATKSTGQAQAFFIRFGGLWEQLAREAEDDIEASRH